MRRLVGLGIAVVLGVVAGGGVAVAAPPEPSAVAVSSTSLVPGQVFTVSFELYNPEGFTVTSANASLRTLEAPVVDLFDLVSCTGSSSACAPFLSSFRGPVGDLPGGEERTVVFTLRVKDDAAPGAYTLEHQFVGANFAFAAGTGPVLTIVPVSQVADIAVGLDASARGLLVSRITYTVSVRNLGPASATGIRVTGSYAAGLSWDGGSGCVRDGSRGVVCDFSSLAVGETKTASFSVNAGLLSLGSFSSSVTRVASSPSDPDSGNDSARRSCTALTSLLVRC